ncbi:hypothetical protein Godav_015488 [Gossypium davidsonii]|uniref:Uncharacterized protein n=1 Tax=Gossypium davidsonii TaxID=34287 RepID=A0A7J8RNA1_GOSDV|nr:hypothetical protein [Gossypium davidsonii]
MENFIGQFIDYDCKAITFSYTEFLRDDQELSFGWDISLKVLFRRAVAPSNRWLREEGGEARLVRPSNGQLRANLGRVNEEILNPYVLPVGYGQNQGLNRRNNMNLVITHDELSNRLSSGGFDDVMRKDDPMVNGEGLKWPRLHLDNSE